jgi:hypothetical protein
VDRETGAAALGLAKYQAGLFEFEQAPRDFQQTGAERVETDAATLETVRCDAQQIDMTRGAAARDEAGAYTTAPCIEACPNGSESQLARASTLGRVVSLRSFWAPPHASVMPRVQARSASASARSKARTRACLRPRSERAWPSLGWRSM